MGNEGFFQAPARRGRCPELRIRTLARNGPAQDSYEGRGRTDYETAANNLAEAERVTAVSAQEPYVHAKLAAAAINLGRARANWTDGRYDQALVCAQDSIRESGLAHRRSREALARYEDPGHLEIWRSWIHQAIETSRMTAGPLSWW